MTVNRIDGYTNTNATTDVQARLEDEIKNKELNQTRQVAMEAGVNAHMKAGVTATAPVPAFSGAGSPEKIGAGKAALETMDKNVGVDYTALLTLLVNMSSEQRKASTEAAVIDVLNVADQMKVAANDIRNGAAVALAGGVVSGAFNIAAGAASIAGGAKSFSISSEGGATPTDISTETETTSTSSAEGSGVAADTAAVDSASMAPEAESPSEAMAQENTEALETDISRQETEAQAKKPAIDSAKMEKTLQKFEAQNRVMTMQQKSQGVYLASSGATSGLQGIGAVAGSMGKFGSDMYQAQSKDDEAIAQKKQAALEREKEYGRAAAEDVKKLMDVFSQLEQSRHETQGKIADTL
ncbi:MAG: type III secretion system translocon subunit SctB [Gammaproteobacteria bacterium]|nr:type III secretion system translocon subunit SctB [Gammaproteobacteria bacterium]